MNKVSGAIKYRIVQALVIFGTLGVFGVGVWGTLQVRTVSHLTEYEVANNIRHTCIRISPVISQTFFFAFESCHLTWSELFHTQIRVEFDPVLLLPAESYLRQWININNEHNFKRRVDRVFRVVDTGEQLGSLSVVTGDCS